MGGEGGREERDDCYTYSNTGMDITCLYTSFYGFICDGIHVTSDVITYHCSACKRRRPNRMLTYVIT